MIRIEKALEKAFYKRLWGALTSEEGYEVYKEFCKDFYCSVFIDHYCSIYREMISDCWSNPLKRGSVFCELSKDIYDSFH